MAFRDVYRSITNSHLLPADRPGQQGGRDQPAPYHLNADHIRADLTIGGDGERPNWPLSCYGPGRDAPRQLLEGAIEQSPEECRVLYHQAVAAGLVGEYVSHLILNISSYHNGRKHEYVSIFGLTLTPPGKQ